MRCVIFRLSTVSQYVCPSITSIALPAAHAPTPTPTMISPMVKRRPPCDSGSVSPNPTVATVMTVMYSASTHPIPSTKR
jgi:hypothetical protein